MAMAMVRMVWSKASSAAAPAARLYLNPYTRSALLPSLCRFCSSDKRPAAFLNNSRNGAEVFLLGIDHVSHRSVEVVQQVIRTVKPNVVAVELCKGRAGRLHSGETIKRLSLWDIFGIPGGLRQKLLTYCIQNLYADFQTRGRKPGEEFRVAIREGHAVGATISFIDRDFGVTLARAGKALSLKGLLSVLADQAEIFKKYPYLYRALTLKELDQTVEALMKRRALTEALQMGENYLPGLMKAFLHERNEFMVKQLRQLEGNVVGIVGALHVDGMHKLWQEAESSSAPQWETCSDDMHGVI